MADLTWVDLDHNIGENSKVMAASGQAKTGPGYLDNLSILVSGPGTVTLYDALDASDPNLKIGVYTVDNEDVAGENYATEPFPHEGRFFTGLYVEIGANVDSVSLSLR